MFNSKPKTSLTKCLAGLSLGLWCVLSASVFASFGVLEESDIDYYGNATTPPFKEAVEGTETLNAHDRAFLSSLDQARLINRWYLRLLIGNARVALNNIESTVALTSSSAQTFVPVSNVNTNLLQGLVAWGKLWDSWAVEGEILISRRLQKNYNPISPGIPLAAFIDTNVYALFFNAQYIVPRFASFYPTRLQIHFDAGFGPVYKTTDLDTSYPNNMPGAATSRSVISLGGNLGFGGRYQITPHILVDVAYRYFSMGSTDFGSTQGLSLESSLIKSTGLFFGGTYQF